MIDSLLFTNPGKVTVGLTLEEMPSGMRVGHPFTLPHIHPTTTFQAVPSGIG